jgi:hypothetical protein
MISEKQGRAALASTGRSCRQSLHRTFALFPQKISIRLAETVHQDASLFRLVSGISSGFGKPER